MMSFVGDNKRVEYMLKDNAPVFSDAENMLFGPKDEELVAKSLSLKTRSKGFFGSTKDQVSTKEGSRRQPFQRGPLFRRRGNRGEEFSQLLVKPCNNNILQEDKEEVRTNLLKASSMR